MKVKLANIMEAFGSKTARPVLTTDEWGRPVNRDEFTGLQAIHRIENLPPKLRYNLGLLNRALEPKVRSYEESAQASRNDAMEPGKDKDGNVVMVPNAQGVVSETYIIPRNKALALEKDLRELLDAEHEIVIHDTPKAPQFTADGKIVWPSIPDPKDPEKDEAKKRKIAPLSSDMSLTMDFIDYSQVE